MNFNEFNEGLFVKMLSTEDCTHYLNIIEVLRRDTNPYTEADLEECLEKLKLVKIDVVNQRLNESIARADSQSEQAYLISEKFKNKKQKEHLINLRRK